MATLTGLRTRLGMHAGLKRGDRIGVAGVAFHLRRIFRMRISFFAGVAVRTRQNSMHASFETGALFIVAGEAFLALSRAGSENIEGKGQR